MLTDSTRKCLRRIVGLYEKKKKTIMSFATGLCLIPENVYGRQLFYRKIYGYFFTCSVEISLVLLLNKMIDSLFMYLSATRDYSFLRDRICIFTKNGISCCNFFSETVII